MEQIRLHTLVLVSSQYYSMLLTPIFFASIGINIELPDPSMQLLLSAVVMLVIAFYIQVGRLWSWCKTVWDEHKRNLCKLVLEWFVMLRSR